VRTTPARATERGFAGPGDVDRDVMDADRPLEGPRWLPVAAFAAAALLAAAFFLHVGFFNDDSLITIRYAENLARGDGLTYNAGEKVLGTTTPLWALLLAAVAWSGRSAPAAATWFGVLAFGWTSAATVLILRNRGAAWWAQALAAALVATSPVLLTWSGSGMETSLHVASIATFLWLFERGAWRALGLVGGAMVLIRPDAGLVLAAAAALEIGRTRSARTLLAVLPGFAVVVLPWLVGAGLYYGSPLPNSGFAKRMQVEDWGSYGAAVGHALWRVGPLLPAALVGFVASGMRARTALPSLALAAIVLGMHLGGLPGCGWYVAAPMYLVVLLAADGASLVAGRLADAGGPLRSPVAIAALVAPLAGHALLLNVAHDTKISQAQVERLHGRVGTWLHDHAPPGASVGVDNIGYIGYRSGLRVVDMLGLVQSDTAAAIGRGERDYALRHHRPELIAMWVGRGATHKYVPDGKWFAENGYRVVFEAPVDDDKPSPAYTVFSRVEIRP
jgi:arabinofuranosyltransferase